MHDHAGTRGILTESYVPLPPPAGYQRIRGHAAQGVTETRRNVVCCVDGPRGSSRRTVHACTGLPKTIACVAPVGEGSFLPSGFGGLLIGI